MRRRWPSQVPASYPMFSSAASSQTRCQLRVFKRLSFTSNAFVRVWGFFLFLLFFSFFYCSSIQSDLSLSDEHSQNNTNTSK